MANWGNVLIWSIEKALKINIDTKLRKANT